MIICGSDRVYARNSLPLSSRDLRLRPVQHLLELTHAVAHTRVHVRLGALDVVVQVVAEVLDVADRCVCDVGVGEVAREEDEGHVADVVCLDEAGEVTKFEGRVASCVEDLRGGLDCGQASRINEFLERQV